MGISASGTDHAQGKSVIGQGPAGGGGVGRRDVRDGGVGVGVDDCELGSRGEGVRGEDE
jgi:hypothetical protein